VSKKRATVFVYYDKDGIVDRYVLFLIQALQKVSEKLVIVCNCELTDAGKKAFGELTDDILIRENTGYDAWGYKAGIEYIGWDELNRYDELVLTNDSVFGPIYPFDTMLDDMDKKNLDFWGITKHSRTPNIHGITEDEFFPEHIQSYFFSICKDMFSHPGFKKYWDELSEIKSLEEAISLHEVLFTKHFSELGFSWDVYVKPDEGVDGFSDISLLGFKTYELVTDYKLPVIKRKVFSTENDIVLGTVISDGVRKTFDFIQDNTSYDINMIWDNILRTMNLKTIRNNLKLDVVLPRDQVSVSVFTRVAVLVSKRLMDKIPAGINETECNEIKVIALPEDGNATSTIRKALCLHMEDYDYICVVNNEAPGYEPLTIEHTFMQRAFENILASKEYITNILSHFEENQRLGVLFPPPCIHGYSAPNNMFWCRPKALSKLLEDDYMNNGFSGEQLYCNAALGEGYYSAYVMTDDFAATEVRTLNNVLADTREVLEETLTALNLVQKSGFVRGIMIRFERYPGLYSSARQIYRFLKKLFRRS